MVFQLKFQWQSYLGTFVFGLYLRASKMHFWLTQLDSLCWGHFEAGKQFWGVILSIGFRTMPTHEIWCPQPQNWAKRGLQKFSVFCCRTLYKPDSITVEIHPNNCKIHFFLFIDALIKNIKKDKHFQIRLWRRLTIISMDSYKQVLDSAYFIRYIAISIFIVILCFEYRLTIPTFNVQIIDYHPIIICIHIYNLGPHCFN